MRRAVLSITVVAFAMCLSSSAVAINLLFLKDRPIASMSKEAYEEFKVAVIHALDNEADGYTLNWTSSGQNCSARVLILNTYELDARPCRKLKIELSVNNRNGRSIQHICKNQAWELQASPIGGFSDADWAFLSKEAEYTLAEVADGVPNSWIIPESRTSGTLVPVNSE